MGTQLPLPKKIKWGTASPFFGPCLLWRNVCVYQDAIWYGGRPQPRQHCVKWGHSCPSPKGAQPQFSSNVRCGQTAGWTKMPLGMEVGLAQATSCSMETQFPPEKGAQPPPNPPPNFWPMPIVAKWLHGSRCHMVHRKTSAEATVC